MNLKVGLLGGAFNPPHNAHLLLAEYSISTFNLDKLIFIPTHIPPHKPIDGKWDSFTRSLMIKIASFSITPDDLRNILSKKSWNNNSFNDFIGMYMEQYPKNKNDKIFVSEIEIERGRKSYTIDTINEILKKNPEWDLLLIIGMDQAAGLGLWKDWRELSKKALVCVADRGELDKDAVRKKYPFLNFFDFPKINISSSQIREKLIDNQSIHGLVPDIIEAFLFLLPKS